MSRSATRFVRFGKSLYNLDKILNIELQKGCAEVISHTGNNLSSKYIYDDDFKDVEAFVESHEKPSMIKRDDQKDQRDQKEAKNNKSSLKKEQNSSKYMPFKYDSKS